MTETQQANTPREDKIDNWINGVVFYGLATVAAGVSGWFFLRAMGDLHAILGGAASSAQDAVFQAILTLGVFLTAFGWVVEGVRKLRARKREPNE